MRTLAVLIFLGLLSSSGDAITVYVPDDYSTIQGAIDAVSNGDSVVVRPGTYHENINFAGKKITVKSELGPQVTTIDGNQSGSVVSFTNGETIDSVIDGFTITNGSSFSYAGGIHCDSSSPLITNNIIVNNSGENGGIRAEQMGPYDSITVTNNIIASNTARAWDLDSGGGGIYCLYGIVNITNNVIVGNTTTTDLCESSSPPYTRIGGGIACVNVYSTSIISGNIIEGNFASYGGGLATNSGFHYSPSITNNIIRNNSASQGGGGIACLANSDPFIINNTVATNNATIAGGGFALADNSEPEITNTIIWDNDAPSHPGIFAESSTAAVVTYCDVQGGWLGTGNISDVPLFVDLTNGDYHLTWASPCRDTGDSAAPGLPAEDFEGNPRVAYGAVDMGADEFHTHLYYTGDAVPGGNIDIRVIGTPNTTPVTLALGSGIQDPPQSTPYGDLYLGLPLLYSFDIGAISSFGVLDYPATIPSSWISGNEYPLQALVGPYVAGSELTNLLVLTLD